MYDKIHYKLKKKNVFNKLINKEESPYSNNNLVIPQQIMIDYAWYIFLMSPLILQFSGTMKPVFPSLFTLSYFPFSL